jgi:hypothetical protein
MKTQAYQNLSDISSNKNYKQTNDPNYRFLNFFNLNESTEYVIGAFNDPKGFNFTPESTIQLGGKHTVTSCKLNATAYDISINNIDYQAKNNYDINKVKIKTLNTPISLNNVVNVDSFNKAESIEYTIGNTIGTTINLVKSIEYFGYIVSSDSGIYNVNLNTEVNGKIIAWFQSGAETTYRSSNSHRNTFSSSEVKNSIYLAKNVFVPFRIQIEFSALTTFSNLPFNITSTSNVFITDFYMLKRDLKKQVVFSYQKDISQCNIYSDNKFENYGIGKQIWETGKETNDIEVVKAIEWELNPDTDTVGLDFSGNVVSYNTNNNILATIFSSNITNQNLNLYSNVNMYLSTDTIDRIRIRAEPIDTSKTVYKLGLNLAADTNVGTNSVENPDWKRFMYDNNNPRNFIYKDLSANGGRDQRITVNSPMVTIDSNHSAPEWMLALDKSRDKPYLVLYKNRYSKTTYYGINVDPKTGRTFYANNNDGVEYIREVPSDFLKYAASSEASTYSQLNYSSYNHYYPPSGTPTSTSNSCTAECNSINDCTHVYEVNGGCIFGTGQPTYLPKQPGSNFNGSTLHVKQKVLDETKIPTDISFSRTYENTNVQSFNTYTMYLPLTASTRAQTSGEYEYIGLQNRAFGSTTTRYNPFQAESSFNIVNPIGMKEGYTSLAQGASGNINTNILTQLQGLSGEFVSYVNQQQQVMTTATDISAAIVDINRKYATMANDNIKYDFTTGKINSLEDDYTLATALLDDNKIFLEEHSNLKIVGTITLATLLISAIFISR